MNTLVVLYRVVIVCLIYHGVQFLWGDGVAMYSMLGRLQFVIFWILLAWVFSKWPEKSSIPLGLLMLISVAVQSSLLRTAQMDLPNGELSAGQGWFSFALSVLPLFIGGICCIVFRFMANNSKNQLNSKDSF